MKKTWEGYITFGVILLLGNLVLTPVLFKEYKLLQFAIYTVFLLLYFLRNYRQQIITPSLKQSTFEKILSLFVLWQGLSVLWATHKGIAVYTTQQWLIVYAFYFITKKHFQDNPQQTKKIVLNLLPILTFAILGHTYYEYFSIKTTTIDTITGTYGKNLYAFTGLVGHKNTVASLLFLLVILNNYGFSESKGTRRVVYGLSLVLSITLILFLESRSVLIAATATLVLAGIVWLIQKASFQFNKKDIGIGIGSIVGLLLLNLFFFDNNSFKERMNIQNWTSSRSFTERILLWKKTTILIKNHALLGVGTGNWYIEFPSVGLGGLAKVERDNKVFGHPHNEFLAIFSETGLVGVILFLLMLGVSIVNLISKLFGKKDDKNIDHHLALLALLSIWGYAFIWGLTTVSKILNMQVFFFFILGWMQSLEQKKTTAYEKKYSLAQNGFWLILWSFQLFVVSQQVQEKKMYKKIIANEIMPTEEAELMESPKALNYYTQSIYQTKFRLGNNLVKAKAYDKAIEQYKEGLEINPHHSTYLGKIGETYFRKKSYDEAVEYLKKAVAINPKYKRMKFRLIQSYIRLKDAKKAMYWVEKTELTPEQKSKLLKEIKAL